MGTGHGIGKLHSLMSSEALDMFVSDFMLKNQSCIFTYYAKRKINQDPNKVIPATLFSVSDAVVWFELYSTDLKVIKDSCGFSDAFADRWKKNIDLMNKA